MTGHSARRGAGGFLAAMLFGHLAWPSGAAADIIPADRLPPGGKFQAGVPGGIPADYREFCDVTAGIPGSPARASADGVTNDAPAINAALALCPAGHYVYIPAGKYRIYSTLVFPKRPVILRGAGSHTDPARTEILSNAGTAVRMEGKPRFGGWLRDLKGGCTVGSRELVFSTLLDTAPVSAGDILVVAEDCNPSNGVSAGGSLESISLTGDKFEWRPSLSMPGVYWVEGVGGADPRLSPANLQQVFYSPGPGTETMLVRSGPYRPNPGQWAFGQFDTQGFRTLYVRLPGNSKPASYPPRTDGVPNGSLWYNRGIRWGGAYLAPGGSYAHLGQGFRVVAKRGAALTLDRPFYWSIAGNKAVVLRYTSFGTGMGLEDLCIRVLQGSQAADTVVVSETANSWVKDVEIGNSSRNFIVASHTLDCEFRGNYVHEPWNAQGGSGYGFRMLGWNFNDLVEDNIAWSCRHSFVLDGINTGLVIAYNFSLDPNDAANAPRPPSPGDYLYQDFLTHGSNPAFCLYEGNVGAKAYADYVHGSAGNLVYFRNHFRLHEGHLRRYVLYKGSETVDFDRWNCNMTVVGNILGYPAIQSDQLADHGRPMVYEGNLRAIYRLGFNADDTAHVPSDNRPRETLLRTGNYDYVNNAIVWDSAIPDHNLPESLYLRGKPAWFGSLPWPPVDPGHPATAEAYGGIIPAMCRFLQLMHGVVPSPK
jgi:hypothetical protein